MAPACPFSNLLSPFLYYWKEGFKSIPKMGLIITIRAFLPFCDMVNIFNAWFIQPPLCRPHFPPPHRHSKYCMWALKLRQLLVQYGTVVYRRRGWVGMTVLLLSHSSCLLFQTVHEILILQFYYPTTSSIYCLCLGLGEFIQISKSYI